MNAGCVRVRRCHCDEGPKRAHNNAHNACRNAGVDILVPVSALTAAPDMTRVEAPGIINNAGDMK